MKYSINDRVIIKSEAWYNENKGPNGDVCPAESTAAQFDKDMSVYCGRCATVVWFCSDGYTLSVDNGEYAWEDWMLEDYIEPSVSISKKEKIENWIIVWALIATTAFITSVIGFNSIISDYQQLLNEQLEIINRLKALIIN